jgi:hypothetical protein
VLAENPAAQRTPYQKTGGYGNGKRRGWFPAGEPFDPGGHILHGVILHVVCRPFEAIGSVSNGTIAPQLASKSIQQSRR